MASSYPPCILPTQLHPPCHHTHPPIVPPPHPFPRSQTVRLVELLDEAKARCRTTIKERRCVCHVLSGHLVTL